MKEINVYPNPFASSFTVTSNKNQSAKVLDCAGASVMEISLHSGNNYVPAGRLPKGIYMLETKEGTTCKMIKY